MEEKKNVFDRERFMAAQAESRRYNNTAPMI